MCFPLPRPRDIRWQLDLAGGATMDAGCYALHQVRHLAGAEPAVVDARARLKSPGVDRLMQVSMQFADGRTARATASMWSRHVLRLSATVRGDGGELRVLNPVAPQGFHRLTVRSRGRRWTEHVTRRPTYAFQLDAFCDAVRTGAPTLTGPPDAVANMTLIDEVYRAAGLEPRQPFAGGGA
jgi:predicted dehydrogenase